MATLERSASEFAEIGQRVADARRGRGYSQAQLAETLVKPDGERWHQTYVGHVERAEKPPSRDFIEAVAMLCEVTPESLLPEGFPLDSLKQGIRDRATKRRRRSRRPLLRTSGSSERTTQHKDEEADIGILFDGEALTIEVGDTTTISTRGAFRASITGGRLQLLG